MTVGDLLRQEFNVTLAKRPVLAVDLRFEPFRSLLGGDGAYFSFHGVAFVSVIVSNWPLSFIH